MSVRRWRPGEAVEPLRRLVATGGVLAIPSESSYGLGADPRSAPGVEAIYRIKGRDRGKPLPVVVASLAQLVDLVGPEGEDAWRPAVGIWPAPLSVLVPIGERPLPAAAGTGTLAVRIPACPPLLDLLERVGPLTATSANLSGGPPILDPDQLEPILAGEPAAIVDAGRLPGGPPSTLVDLREGGAGVLRAGAHPWKTRPGARS